MQKIEIKRVKANMTLDEMQPHWVAEVDYGFVQVEIPLPARNLPGDEVYGGTLESLEAMEALANAMLKFASEVRDRMNSD